MPVMRPLELERVKNNAIRAGQQESSPKENETIGCTCTAVVSRKIDSMYHNFANWPSVSMSDEHASGRGRTAAQFSNRRQYITSGNCCAVTAAAAVEYISPSCDACSSTGNSRCDLQLGAHGTLDSKQAG
ncbi:hypothetical protein DAPPUDRAFT_114429 [Daphnia pulex]|uniref:Uncharacterized protein n=1 Tax=Daphnia pulex TaxID=6669 RepID=E9HI40_DAPPU|nr:hypothetical protein DAPPUDRAFT_114429 [Daphnia pulex]|eukprot:EFX68589.1 hypothetical protein DAPPUDRAFT_114429 [Daphnia pulex]